MASLDRSLSVNFIHEDVSTKEVLTFLWNNGGENQLDTCREMSSKCIEVTFLKKDIAEQFASEESVNINGKIVKVEAVGSMVKTVYVKGLPPQLGDDVVNAVFSSYGRIAKPIERERYKEPPFQSVCTGTRIVRIEMNKKVPNFLRIGRYEAMCSYAGVVKVCRRCDREGHLANSCKVTLCYNCRKEGHIEANCMEPCSRCSETGHTVSHCKTRSFADAVTGRKVESPKPVSITESENPTELRKEVAEKEIVVTKTSDWSREEEKSSSEEEIFIEEPKVQRKRPAMKKHSVQDFLKEPLYSKEIQKEDSDSSTKRKKKKKHVARITDDNEDILARACRSFL